MFLILWWLLACCCIILNMRCFNQGHSYLPCDRIFRCSSKQWRVAISTRQNTFSSKPQKGVKRMAKSCCIELTTLWFTISRHIFLLDTKLSIRSYVILMVASLICGFVIFESQVLVRRKRQVMSRRWLWFQKEYPTEETAWFKVNIMKEGR